MIVLGIESTAHTFGAAVFDSEKNEMLSNHRDMYTTEEGGMIPFDLTEHHLKVCDEVVKKALETANVTIKNIDLIAYSSSPGLGHALKVGLIMAKSLALINDISLVAVNHCVAHLEIASLVTKANDPVLLYCSGANTQVIAYEGKKYRVFGETLDTGVGNFLDTFGRNLGLGFPGGPKIEQLALKGKKLIDLPYSVKGMDVAFSGLETNLKRKIKNKEESKEDLCFSVQETVFAMLLEVAERAMAHCNKKELVLGGGVACNKRLQEMANKMCETRGAKCFVPENQYLVDNAGMITYTGYLMFKKGGVSVKAEEASVNPYERIESIDVTWR